MPYDTCHTRTPVGRLANPGAAHEGRTCGRSPSLSSSRSPAWRRARRPPPRKAIRSKGPGSARGARATAHGNDIIVVLDWDGKAITGMINPGTDNMPIRNATLDPDGWVVRFEADGKDRSGTALSYVIEGTIENLRRSQPLHQRHLEEPARERPLQDHPAVGQIDAPGWRRTQDRTPHEDLRWTPAWPPRRWPGSWRRAPASGAPRHPGQVRRAASRSTLSGIVTLVDWRIRTCTCSSTCSDAARQVVNWAVELESPLDLRAERLDAATRCGPATRSPSTGIAARNGSRAGVGATRSRSPAPPTRC